jgi:hypothetical protein
MHAIEYYAWAPYVYMDAWQIKSIFSNALSFTFCWDCIAYWAAGRIPIVRISKPLDVALLYGVDPDLYGPK